MNDRYRGEYPGKMLKKKKKKLIYSSTFADCYVGETFRLLRRMFNQCDRVIR